MGKIQLQEIDRVSTISKEDFLENYYKPQKPVVVEKVTEDWPAYEKWHLEYIREIAGEKLVPLYDDRPISHEEGFNEAHETMKMKEYLNMLEAGPTNYRIFLYNLMKEAPTLQDDFRWPDFGLRLIKKLPMLFFGGENSKVFMHYDIDYANIFHFNFHGKKQCMLFAPDQTKYMYRVPHSLISREDIDFDNPDFEKWPALQYLEGFICQLGHGEMLYMPEGYWHYMKYLKPSISMSLRSYPSTVTNFAKATYNLVIMRGIDNLMRRIRGQKWIDMRNERAITDTHRAIGIQ